MSDDTPTRCRARSGREPRPGLRRVCAWCGAVVAEGAGSPCSTSHVMCSACAERLRPARRASDPDPPEG